MGFLSGVKNRATSLLSPLWENGRIKLLNRVMVVVGLVFQFYLGLARTALEASPTAFLRTLAYIFFNSNHQIILGVETLKAGVGLWEFIGVTLGIYSQIWILWWLINKLANIQSKWYAGEYNPRIPQLIYIAAFEVAILQFTGGVIHQYFTAEERTMNALMGRETVPFYGFYMIAMNLDLWINPISSAISNIPYIGDIVAKTRPDTNNWV